MLNQLIYLKDLVFRIKKMDPFSRNLDGRSNKMPNNLIKQTSNKVSKVNF